MYIYMYTISIKGCDNKIVLPKLSRLRTGMSSLATINWQRSPRCFTQWNLLDIVLTS